VQIELRLLEQRGDSAWSEARAYREYRFEDRGGDWRIVLARARRWPGVTFIRTSMLTAR
jgi:hypothetical protein